MSTERDQSQRAACATTWAEFEKGAHDGDLLIGVWAKCPCGWVENRAFGEDLVAAAGRHIGKTWRVEKKVVEDA